MSHCATNLGLGHLSLNITRPQPTKTHETEAKTHNHKAKTHEAEAKTHEARGQDPGGQNPPGQGQVHD